MTEDTEVEADEADDSDWYVLLWGVDLDADSFDLGSGLRIQKLQSPFQFWDLLAAATSGFREAQLLTDFAPGLRSEIYSPHDPTAKCVFEFMKWMLAIPRTCYL